MGLVKFNLHLLTPMWGSHDPPPRQDRMKMFLAASTHVCLPTCRGMTDGYVCTTEQDTAGKGGDSGGSANEKKEEKNIWFEF